MTKLVVGPVLYNWDKAKLMQFYHELAASPDVETVCVGEVICAKRPKHDFDEWLEIIDLLLSHNKKVRYSTLGVITNTYEINMLKKVCASSFQKDPNFVIEVNDITALPLIGSDSAFTIGQLFNCYNEASVGFLQAQGAGSITLPVELSFAQVQAIAETTSIDLGVQVFGRMPLALSVRCYQARAYNLQKQNCGIICENDLDGLAVETLDNAPIFAVNGLQTLSYNYCNLISEIDQLIKAGISELRISPQYDVDNLAVCHCFSDAIKQGAATEDTINTLKHILQHKQQSNGYFYEKPGMNLIPAKNINH